MAAGSSVPGRWLRGALVVGWHPGGMGQSLFADRVDRVRGRMAELGLDAVLLSVGPDLPYLTGYEAMPLERLTMLVLPRGGEGALVVPRLEAPPEIGRAHV